MNVYNMTAIFIDLVFFIAIVITAALNYGFTQNAKKYFDDAVEFCRKARKDILDDNFRVTSGSTEHRIEANREMLLALFKYLDLDIEKKVVVEKKKKEGVRNI